MVTLTSFSPPTDGVKHEESSTIAFANGRELGCGTLYIAESKLSWRNSSGEGFSLLYPHIAVHAVSRDIDRFGSECLYIMVDTCLDDVETNEDEDENNDEAGGMIEVRFVPEDKGQLDAMFQAMTYCQSQHPDPENQLSDDEEEEYLDADEEGEYNLAGGDSGYIEDIMCSSLNTANGFREGEDEMETDGQFEDAEDED